MSRFSHAPLRTLLFAASTALVLAACGDDSDSGAPFDAEGTSNDVPRAINGDPNNNLRVSTHFIEDGSYVRLKNLTFGYTLPKSVMSRISATQIRVYFTAQNLATLTKYTGYDPEVSASGVDRGIYPQTRVFMGGLNIGF